MDWTVDHVASWLAGNPALAAFAPVFKQYAIDGKMLQKGLSDSHLDEMDIKGQIHRSKITAEIEYLMASLSSSRLKSFMNAIYND